jgi:hypothetical protein
MPVAQAGEDSAQRSAIAAHDFLKTRQRGKDILDYVHFGATYRGHEYVETRSVVDGAGLPVEGRFALVYRFYWENDGVTDVAFLCDPRGSVYAVKVTYTNAVLSQPFALANVTIQVLGNVLIRAYQDKMTGFERRMVQKLVDNADAKGLLEWSLRFQQVSGT